MDIQALEITLFEKEWNSSWTFLYFFKCLTPWRWLAAAEDPDENATRKMFTEVMKIAFMFVMKKHMYMFDNQIKRQSEGGPIGLELLIWQIC